MPSFKFNVNIYNPVQRSGDWTYICGYLEVDGKPCYTCEVWLEVDGVPTKPQYTYDTGFFWYWFRARAGIYRIRLVAFRVRCLDTEYVLKSKTYRIVYRPSLSFLNQSLLYEVKVYRKITLDEVLSKVRIIRNYLYSKGIKEIYLAGSIARQGYSFHDVDLYLVPTPTREDMTIIERDLTRLILIPVDIRKTKKKEKVIRIG